MQSQQLHPFIFKNDEKYKKMERDFFDLLFFVMIKIESMRYHMSNYEQKEKIHIEKIKLDYEQNPYSQESAFDLLSEIEAFIFQTKSSLDITVKVFNILFKGKFELHTFHKKGEELVKRLEKFKKESTKKETVENIISLIKEDRNCWLDNLIRLRDTFSHYRTIPNFTYWIEEKDNKKTIHMPAFNDLFILDFTKLVYQNCLEFIQDILCLTIELFWPETMRIATKPTYGKENPNAPMEKFIKFGISITSLQTAN